MRLPYTGGCQCAQIRYKIIKQPIRLIVCHCKECQTQSGSAFGMSMHINKDSIHLTGKLKTFHRIADSGHKNTGCFCPNCGNRIYNIPQSLNGIYTIKPGTLDDTSWLRPTSFIWTKSAQGWVPTPKEIEVINGQTLKTKKFL